jgi:hypothetical protein
MKFYDFICRKCSILEERCVRRPEEPQHCACGSVMHKLPPATRTTFRFADKRK